MASPAVAKAQMRSGARSNPKASVKPVRLTIYITPEKDFALRYLALRKHTSVNKLLNTEIDGLLTQESINPETLEQALP
jgi:hypothetical protein